MIKRILLLVIFCIFLFNIPTLEAFESLTYDDGNATTVGSSVFDITYTMGSENKSKYIYFSLSNIGDHHYWLKFNNTSGELSYSTVGSSTGFEVICTLELGREYNITAVYSYGGGSSNSSFRIYIDGVQCGGVYNHASEQFPGSVFTGFDYTLGGSGNEIVHNYIPGEISSILPNEHELVLSSGNSDISARINYADDEHILKLKGSHSLASLGDLFSHYNLEANRDGSELLTDDILESGDKLLLMSENNIFIREYLVSVEADESAELISFSRDGLLLSASSDFNQSGHALYLAQYVGGELVDLDIDDKADDGYSASLIIRDDSVIKAFIWKNDLTSVYSKIYSK